MIIQQLDCFSNLRTNRPKKLIFAKVHHSIVCVCVCVFQCFSAIIDGTHIAITSPPKHYSKYFLLLANKI